MLLPSVSFPSRHRPVHELSREGSGVPSVEERRRQAGIVDRNALSPAEARDAIHAIQAKTLREPAPDSTPLIRADRDGR